MEIAMYRSAVSNLCRLDEEWSPSTYADYDWPARLSAVHRLVRLAVDVADAVDGGGAATVLRDRADEFRAETERGTWFWHECMEAKYRVTLATDAEADPLDAPFEACYCRGRIMRPHPDPQKLPICRHLGYASSPRPVEIDIPRFAWDLMDQLVGLHERPLVLPLVICRLEILSTAIGGNRDLDTDCTTLLAFFEAMRANTAWGSALMLTLSGEHPELHRAANKLLQTMLPLCVEGVFTAAEALGPQMAEVPATERQSTESGTSHRRGRPGRPRANYLDERDRLIRAEHERAPSLTHREIADVLAERHKDREDWQFSKDIVRNVVESNRRGGPSPKRADAERES